MNKFRTKLFEFLNIKKKLLLNTKSNWTKVWRTELFNIYIKEEANISKKFYSSTRWLYGEELIYIHLYSWTVATFFPGKSGKFDKEDQINMSFKWALSILRQLISNYKKILATSCIYECNRI